MKRLGSEMFYGAWIGEIVWRAKCLKKKYMLSFGYNPLMNHVLPNGTNSNREISCLFEPSKTISFFIFGIPSRPSPQ